MTVRKLRVLLGSVVVLGVISLDSPSHAAAEDRALTISAKTASTAFWIDKPGPVTIHLVAPSSIQARLFRPGGEIVTKRGAATLDLTATATEADVATGKVWVLAVGAEGGPPAKAFDVSVKIDAPGGPVSAKDLVTKIETAARALPKVPEGHAVPTPLFPDASSVARIVAAKIPNGHVNTSAIGGKIVQSAPALPPFVPRPASASSSAAKAAIGANSNNYGGVFPDPEARAGRTFVPIVAIEVTDDEGSHVCTTSCVFKAGDVLTFTLGGGMDALGHEVHFSFFDPPRDVAVSVLEWKEDVKRVAVQVPHFGADAFDKPGALFIGTGSAKASSSFFGFKYDPTITLLLPFDAKAFPPPAAPATLAPTAPGTRAAAEHLLSGPLDNATRWIAMRGGAVSASGRDTFFGGAALKNGWVVKRVESQGWTTALIPGLAASHVIVESRPAFGGSATPTFSVDWSYDAATTLAYTVALKVQGRDGTLPF